MGKNGVVPLRLYVAGFYLCLAALCIVYSDASHATSGSHRYRTRRHFRSRPNTKWIRKNQLHAVRKFDMRMQLDDVSNTDPYVSSPFSLQPFDALPPIPLTQNAPPYCINPPSTPQPPSTVPSPTGVNPLPPLGPIPSPVGGETPLPPPGLLPPVAPIPSPTGGDTPLPPPGPPGGYPLPPLAPIPSPIGGNTPLPPPGPSGGYPIPPVAPIPSPIGGDTPLPPPGPNPPSIPIPPESAPIPNTPTIIPNPPIIIPNPPTIPTPTQPVLSPPYFEPNPPSSIPSPTGTVPRSPRFLPPIVFPPPSVPPPPYRAPTTAMWCVAKAAVPDPIIQEAMDYACGSGADCGQIQPSGPCFQPNTLFAHASYAFNSYWQRTKVTGGRCDFGGTAILVTVDPSFDGCHFTYF